MILDWRDERWNNIYRHFVSTHYGRVTRKEMEKHLLDEGIRVIKDPSDGRWEGVEIADDELLTMLMLKFGSNNDTK
jgi:hypothetical protein